MSAGIGDWILRRAAEQQRAWYRAGRPVRLGVNVSTRQLRDRNLAVAVEAALRDSGMDPAALELIVDENATTQYLDVVAATMARLALRGVQFAIGEFGVGNSVLSRLRQLPVTGLRVGVGYVRELSATPADTRLVSALLALARTFGLRVVFPGVDNANQLDQLRMLGADEVVGARICVPLTAGAFAQWLDAREGASAPSIAGIDAPIRPS